MSKKIYHIPLQKVRTFMANEKAILHKLLQEKQKLEYYKRFGKMRYDEQIEKFLIFFKIDKNISHALRTIEYFSSKLFVDEIGLQLNFSQFEFEKNNTPKKDFFYGLCYLLYLKDKTMFEQFLHQLFLHFHSSFNQKSNIVINYKEIVEALLKNKQQKLKESFGEDEEGSFFKLILDEKENISLRGKSIKNLRKEAYKHFLRKLTSEL